MLFFFFHSNESGENIYGLLGFIFAISSRESGFLIVNCNNFSISPNESYSITRCRIDFLFYKGDT